MLCVREYKSTRKKHKENNEVSMSLLQRAQKQMDHIKLESFCKTKETKNAEAAHGMGKLFANTASNKWVISRLYKVVHQLNNKNNQNPI